MTDVCFLCERNPITWPGTGMCEQCEQETADMASAERYPLVEAYTVSAAIPDLLLRVMRGRVGALRLEDGHWRGDCPWCDEDGELCQSLYVYPNFYHCFACGAHGDAISFLMWAEDLRFMQTVEWLAKEYGIELGERPA